MYKSCSLYFCTNYRYLTICAKVCISEKEFKRVIVHWKHNLQVASLLSDESVIQESPGSPPAPVMEGETAWFSCTILCDYTLLWFVDGSKVMDDSSFSRKYPKNCSTENNSQMQRLGINATLDRHRTSIQCAATSEELTVLYFSYSALLTVSPGTCVTR